MRIFHPEIELQFHGKLSWSLQKFSGQVKQSHGVISFNLIKLDYYN
jgi:hypothetical protein